MSKYQALIDSLKAGPTAYARKWHVDGVEPKKELNGNGRWAWPAKFKILPITELKFSQDDVALWAVDLPALLSDLERAEKALKAVAAWGPFPRVPDSYSDEPGATVSYAVAFGSNGERDYIRGIAQAALAQMAGG